MRQIVKSLEAIRGNGYALPDLGSDPLEWRPRDLSGVADEHCRISMRTQDDSKFIHISAHLFLRNKPDKSTSPLGSP